MDTNIFLYIWLAVVLIAAVTVFLCIYLYKKKMKKFFSMLLSQGYSPLMNDPSTMDSLKQRILGTKLSTRHPGEETAGIDIKEAASVSVSGGNLYVFTAKHWHRVHRRGKNETSITNYFHVMLLKPTEIKELSVSKRNFLGDFIVDKGFGHVVKEVQGSNPKFNKNFTVHGPKDSDIQMVPSNLEQALMKYVDKYPLKNTSFSLSIKPDGVFLQCARPGSFAKLQDAIELTKDIAV